MTPNAWNSPEMRIQAPDMAYSYAKHAQYGRAMQRQKLDSPKKGTFTVINMAKQQAQVGKKWHARIKDKRWVMQQVI